MKQASSSPTNDAPLVALAYELLDAHLDTVELTAGAAELRWRAHLDYLRALVRKTEEILARFPATEIPLVPSRAQRTEESK